MKLRFKNGRRLWLLAIPFLAIGVWYECGAVTYATSLRLYVVPSGSMSPAIAPGDRICVEPSHGATPKRGEIWLVSKPGATFVKRVVGLPGESVEVVGGRVMIDGRPLAEPYIAGPMSYSMAPVRLKRGQYFVLGDSRNASFDSHDWGPAEDQELIGRVKFRPWPPNRVGGIR